MFIGWIPSKAGIIFRFSLENDRPYRKFVSLNRVLFLGLEKSLLADWLVELVIIHLVKNLVVK